MLTAYRKLKSLSLRELAGHIGVSVATLSRIENGQGEIDSKTYSKVLVWMMEK
jgi:transcriptional regulator with XRE-family HTH domain